MVKKSPVIILFDFYVALFDLVRIKKHLTCLLPTIVCRYFPRVFRFFCLAVNRFSPFAFPSVSSVILYSLCMKKHVSAVFKYLSCCNHLEEDLSEVYLLLRLLTHSILLCLCWVRQGFSTFLLYYPVAHAQPFLVPGLLSTVV
jgi:hypothetical protein